MDTPTIEMRNIYKIYPDGVVALRGVSLTVRKGEIHGLLGENGAGKTTLMRILYGEIKPSKGEIYVKGERVNFSGPWEAIRKGIGMVYQHFTLVPSFTALENLYLSYLSINPRARKLEVIEKAKDIISSTGLSFPFDEEIDYLPVGVQQRIEIVKALIRDAEILILDEPTSVLTPIEVEELFNALRRLKEKGLSIIFITHKLREVMDLADKITVLRKGKVVGSFDKKNIEPRMLARLMIGEEMEKKTERKTVKPGEPVLLGIDITVTDQNGVEKLRKVGIEVRRGEIHGLAGVQGNGQLELAEVLAGIRRPASGKVFLKGEDVTELNSFERYRKGLAYVPESRRTGLIGEMNILENVLLTNLHIATGKAGMIDWKKANALTIQVLEKLGVSTPSPYHLVKHLSGGNQQKVMVGREVIRNPEVFIVAEPTQGLDIAATRFIRNTLTNLRNQGKAILLISSDLDEILELSDRVSVIYQGRIFEAGTPDKLTTEKIGLLMGGVTG